MHLSAKAKDEALKKLRIDYERLQEEKEDLMNGAGSVRQLSFRVRNELNPQSSNNQSNDSEVIARLKTEAREIQEKWNKSEMEKKRLIEEARQV